MRRIAIILLGLALFAGAYPAFNAAQAQAQEDIIREIVVEGTNRIDPETVGSYLTIQVGDPFDRSKLDESLRRLFATGLFSDVSIRREGNSLIVRVVENPIINRVAFEGNDELEDGDLASEIPLRPRAVYTRARVQAAVERILELYRQQGYFAATVEPKVINRPQNRVDLVFEIDEGEVTGVRRITFIGNRVYSDGDLREVIQTRETAWWRFLSSSDVYDPDRLRIDQELLRRYYLRNGYADYRLVSAVAELTPDRKDFFITFTVFEGERYRVGNVEVVTSLEGTEASQFDNAVEIESGDWYNADAVEQSITSLTDAAGTLGYAFVDVQPRVRRNQEEQTLDITFEVREGPRVFVERIEIVGNTRTRDEVIRREILIAEGDAFNTSRIRDSRRRLINLDYFENVEVSNREGSSPDRTIVTFTVVEKATGQLSLGAGFSTDEGVLGSIGIQESNFMGRGQRLSLAFTLSQRRQQIDLSFTEPYFLDRNLSFTFDVFRLTQNFEDEGGYDSRETGFRVRFGTRITEKLSASLQYELNDQSIRNIATNASTFVRSQEGAFTKSSVTASLTYDTRDNRIDPTSGYYMQGSVEYAGLGGSESFVIFETRGAYYYPVRPRWILTFAGRAAHIEGLFGNDIPLTERFYIGGANFRGFEYGGVGPRDRATDTALGSETYYVLTAELTFPIGLPAELGVRGRVWTDVGSAFGIDFRDPSIIDASAPRVSAGVGISWASPLGPLRFDLGFPLIKQGNDQTRIFNFQFGTRF